MTLVTLVTVVVFWMQSPPALLLGPETRPRSGIGEWSPPALPKSVSIRLCVSVCGTKVVSGVSC